MNPPLLQRQFSTCGCDIFRQLKAICGTANACGECKKCVLILRSHSSSPSFSYAKIESWFWNDLVANGMLSTQK